MIFCQATYAAGPTDAIGSRYVSDIHIANTVFFWPSPCAPEILSPYLRPTIRPIANCNTHTASEAAAIIIISGTRDAGSWIMKLTAFPTTMIRAHAQR